MVRPEQLVTSRVDPGQHDQRYACVCEQYEPRGVTHQEIGATVAQALVESGTSLALHVLNSRKAIRLEQVVSNPLRCKTGRADVDDSHGRRFRWRLRERRPGLSRRTADRDPYRRGPKELTPPHAFSSFLSSLRKRQSVPWAMIFCGLDLIIPASCRRSARKRTVSSGSSSRHLPNGISFRVWSARS